MHLLQLYCKNTHIIRTKHPTYSFDTQLSFSYYHRLIGKKDMVPSLDVCSYTYNAHVSLSPVSSWFCGLCLLQILLSTLRFRWRLYIHDVCCTQAVKFYHVHTLLQIALITWSIVCILDDVMIWPPLTVLSCRCGEGWVETSPVVLDDELKENMDREH